MLKIPLSREVKLRSRKRRRGSVALEFILIAPFLIWITFAVCEYGIVINTISTINQLARDGGRYAAIHATESTAYMDGKTANSIRTFIEFESQQTSVKLTQAMESQSVPPIRLGIIDPDPTHTTTYGKFIDATPRAPGTPVAVAITYDMSKRVWGSGIVPGLSNFTSTTKPKIVVFLIEKPTQ